MAETKAVLRGVRLSVDKGRLVADLIRGKKVDQALNILNFTQKKAAVRGCCFVTRIPRLRPRSAAQFLESPLQFPLLDAND